MKQSNYFDRKDLREKLTARVEEILSDEKFIFINKRVILILLKEIIIGFLRKR